MYIKKALIQKIKTRKCKIGVIGMGYVGLPLVLRFTEEGFSVQGFDVDDHKVAQLNAGKSYIEHIPSDRIEQAVSSKKFSATADFTKLSAPDCILICVPTPLDERNAPDMRFVNATTYELAAHLREGQLICLESTTYPGTTREVLLPKFASKGLKIGEDFFLAFSPEREDPGNKRYTTKNIPKVVGGITDTCTEVASVLYNQVVEKVVPVSSSEVAEFTKLLENIFRAVNIALVNELKVLATKMGVDIWEIIEASSTKPFGFMPFYPGPGLGGHCIPIDPFYLAWKAKEFDFNTHFIELAGEVNTSMPNYVISRLTDALNDKGKCLKGAKILILGLAYKADTDDARESPALELLDTLKRKGSEISYNDPHIPMSLKLRRYSFDLTSTELTSEVVQSMDAVIIATAHAVYDYDWIVENSCLVIDTRNATKDVVNNRDKIVKA